MITHPKAFSLIELLLVLGIAATVSMIALPRYANSLAQYRVDMAARRVASDLSLVQSRARSSCTSRKLVFTAATATYVLPAEPDQKRSSDVYNVDLTLAPYRASMGVASFGGDATLIFNGYGVPDSGGSITLQSGNFKRTITVEADSGFVSIK